jgi:hypothetical protein
VTDHCTCSEIRINGKIIPGINPAETHDCSYVRARNALIPAACALASRQTGDATQRTPAWSTAFAGAMTHLWAEHVRGMRPARIS